MLALLDRNFTHMTRVMCHFVHMNSAEWRHKYLSMFSDFCMRLNEGNKKRQQKINTKQVECLTESSSSSSRLLQLWPSTKPLYGRKSILLGDGFRIYLNRICLSSVIRSVICFAGKCSSEAQ